MASPYSRKSASEMLDIYFIENRAKLLDIASFLDRIDRYGGAKADFRYKAFVKAMGLLLETKADRTKALQMVFSDRSVEPVNSAVGLKAVGAFEGAFHEGN